MTAIVPLAGYRRICANVLVAAVVVAVAGCAGADKKPAKPRQTAAPKSVIVTDQVEQPGAYKTPDGYPDLNKPLTAANAQMTNTDAKSLEDKLAILATQRKSGQISEKEYNRRVEEFRKMGQTQ
jgi:hypothetical protein